MQTQFYNKTIPLRRLEDRRDQLSVVSWKLSAYQIIYTLWDTPQWVHDYSHTVHNQHLRTILLSALLAVQLKSYQ